MQFKTKGGGDRKMWVIYFRLIAKKARKRKLLVESKSAINDRRRRAFKFKLKFVIKY